MFYFFLVDGKRVDAKRQHFKSKDKDDKLFVGGIPSDFTDGQLADYFRYFSFSLLVSNAILVRTVWWTLLRDREIRPLEWQRDLHL